VAYSFGSIVALDTFFPRQNPASHLISVDTLVTIGCPADLVRIFWPKYYGLSERAYRPGAPQRWINIYSTTDVLSSNFRNDNKKDSANVSIAGATEGKEEELKPFNVSYEGGPLGERLTIPNIILLLGLRAHAMYWERDGKAGSDVGCFSILVPHIYQSADWVPSSRK
jgi:hypothetical protein